MSEETKANQTEEAVSKEHESQEKYWYVVHTQTGHEDKVKEKILTQIKVQNFGDRVFNVLVPTEEVVEVKQNKKTLRKRKFFPGYILVEMILTSQTYWFIRNIIGVTGFLGDPYPVPLPEEEIAGIVELTTATDGKPKHAVQFDRGEQVRVTEGPFKHFVGVIEEVNEAKNKLKVMVTVFDRATPVEVDYLQVEKIN
ncbi:transcription termination/antitermination protein NusG [Candidatus Proelusimicrobium volucris]|uniref:transcription termination/antitermination protein NusG n=1 Tax=Candidatus Proelusimicrobium volucris TaxID=3416225 RepID=UPI003D09E312